jgi:nickel-dependent lactate racemase
MNHGPMDANPTMELRTGIWYNDRSVTLTFPGNWEVTAIEPATPPPLSDADLGRALDEPVGQPPLEERARGSRSAAVIVDDLSRPTPAHRVMPLVLDRLNRAGIPDEAITVVVATGTHGDQGPEAIASKVGTACVERCRIVIHDDLTRTAYVGTTSFGTRAHVNRDVLAADFLVGVGGVYPQHTTGFGGGSKLALGVSARRTIMELHFKHPSMEGTYDTDNDFRRDVTEIARMIGLETLVTLHVDGASNVVRAVSGDHFAYYDEAAAFSRSAYDAPIPDERWDVVIANAYPLDTSFTFMRKGYKPLYAAPRSCVKVMIASAYEGVGVHGLFQYIDPSLGSRLRNLMVRLRNVEKRKIPAKIWNRVMDRIRPPAENGAEEEKVTALPPNSDHLYVWRTDPDREIPPIDDLTVRADWTELVEEIDRRHFAGRETVRACVYTCAPLQCLDTGRTAHGVAS